jgi:ubiquinone/menaquinone biosynthesis C-methylase UbiE
MSRPRRLSEKVRQRTFDRPKGLLGRLGGLIMARANRETVERAITLLDVQPGDRVLEIGFGPGVGIELLARAAPSGYVAGIDPSYEMLRQARSRNADGIAASRVDLRLGSVESLPFDDASFDKALATNSLQVWSDPLAGLREVHRVLRPGGRLVLSFTRRSGRPPEELRVLLAEAGFVRIELTEEPERGRFFVAATRG